LNKNKGTLPKEYIILKRKLKTPDRFMPVLTNLISHEESRILVLIAEKFLTASAIAEKLAGQPLKKVSSTLEKLYQNGILYKKEIYGETAYKCRSFYDIISSFLQENRYEVLGFETLHLLRQYYLSTRIRKAEKNIEKGQLKYSSKVIPIRKAVQATRHILPTQQAICFLKEVKSIALAKCGCRVAFKNCTKPLNTCLLLDKEAEYLKARGYAKEISIEKAEKVLEIADKAGLVHLTLYLPGQKVYAICSCCPCCCHDLQALLKYGKRFFIAKSDYMAVSNLDLCNGCGACINRCVFNAREMRDGKSIVNEANCYGCGLCVTTCPTGASKLVPQKKAVSKVE
jgi:NAD-dependent dihydropyrimidine dehydrogenase PreA subunit